MKKKMPIIIAVLLMLLFLILGFMTAFVLEDMRYEARIRELTNAGTDTEPQDTGNVPEDTDKPADTQQGNTDPGGNTDDGAGYSEFIRKLADKLALIDALYRYNYLYELDDDALMDSVLKGYVAGTGDLYGAYYNPEEYTEFLNDMNAEFSGLGVHVIFNSDYGLIEVLNVIPGSPAEEAGMLPGDLIYSVMIDGEEVLAYDLGYYPTIGKLRGEEGTEAVFSVYRGEDYSERVDFTIVRRKIDEISVESRVYSLDSTIGIVRISEFDLKTLNQLRAELNKLIDSGCDKYVFDLRYNPGGELTSIINVLDFLLPGGPIVHIVDRDGNEEQVFYSGATFFAGPMVVLVNGSTASAAELFTAAMKDYGRAKIIGTNTYGKGIMQSSLELGDGDALTITTRYYNPPYSENYHGVGVAPDVVVELSEEAQSKNFYKLTDEEDNQLTEAVRVLLEEAETYTGE